MDPELMAMKKDAENRLRKAIADDPAKQKQFGKIWDEIAAYVNEYRAFYVEYSLLEWAGVTGSELFTLARTINRYVVEKPKPNADRLREFSDAALPATEMAMYSTAPVYPALGGSGRCRVDEAPAGKVGSRARGGEESSGRADAGGGGAVLCAGQ